MRSDPRTEQAIAAETVWQHVQAVNGARVCAGCGGAVPHGARCLLAWRGREIVAVACGEGCKTSPVRAGLKGAESLGTHVLRVKDNILSVAKRPAGEEGKPS